MFEFYIIDKKKIRRLNNENFEFIKQTNMCLIDMNGIHITWKSDISYHEMILDIKRCKFFKIDSIYIKFIKNYYNIIHIL